MSTNTPDIELRFRNSLFRSLLEISRLYQAQMMQELSSVKGHAKLKLAYQGVIMNIPDQGIRPTELAKLLDMQKQNAGTLLKQVEKAGYIYRQQDTTDKRAQLITLSNQGKQLIQDGVEVTTELDSAIESLVGPEHFALIKQSLIKLAIALDLQEQATYSEKQPALFIRTLIDVTQHSSKALFKLLRSSGHKEIRTSHGQVIMHIGNSGARIRSIAKANDVSKQAIAAIVCELASLGYLSTAPDPQDKRSKIILIDDKGQELIVASVKAADTLISRYTSFLGKKKFSAFEKALADLYHKLSSLGEVSLLETANSWQVTPHFSLPKQNLCSMLALLYSLEKTNTESSELLCTDSVANIKSISLSKQAISTLKKLTMSEEECEQSIPKLLRDLDHIKKRS